MALLDLGINYGASYSLNFATDIISNREGIEQRRALYQQPLLKVAIGNRMVNKEELDYLLAFFEAAQGRLNEFEIRDWTDYQVTDGTLGPVIEGRQSVIKTYSLGGETISRLLTAVVEETIVDDGGAISCEFNVPVRFDQDAFPLTFEAYSPDGERLFALQELTCTEVRKAWPDAPLEVPPASIDADLGIGKDYGTTGGQAYSTSIMALPSGWDDRQANYSGSKSQWNIGAKLVNVAEMTRIISMFRLCRGQLVPFNFYDWQTESTRLVRFDSDSLGLQFEAHQENYYGPAIGDRESLFAINGLPVKAINENNEHIESFSFLGPGFNTLYEFIFTSSNGLVPQTASIYLMAIFLDSQGTLGTFTRAETIPDEFFAYSYNWATTDPTWINETGPEILIGTGNSVSGTCIEDENSGNPEARCEAILRFVWS